MDTRSSTSDARRATARGLTLALAGALALTTVAGASTAQAQRWPWQRRGDGGYGSSNGNAGGYGNGARTLYSWSGRIDREATIVMENGDVRTRLDGDSRSREGRVRVASGLPRTDGYVDVRVEEGRGRVDVIEQPSSRNGYRAVVRVRDDDAGQGTYRLTALWRPTNNGGGGYGSNGGYGRGDDNDGRDRHRDGGGWGRDGGRDGNDDGRGNTGGGYGNTGGGYGNGGGYGSGGLQWRGRVDDVEEIRIQGRRVDARTLSGRGAEDVQSRLVGNALPPQDVQVRVSGNGRGRVSVVQQPQAWNGYTAIVRIEDHDAGAAYYNVDVRW